MPPFLVIGGRESNCSKSGEGFMTNSVNPSRFSSSYLAFQSNKLLMIEFCAFYEFSHRSDCPSRGCPGAVLCDSFSSQAYPFSSTVSASSFPPDFTMRPPRRTCT